MRSPVLRRSRIVFSAIVFILFCLIFIDFRSIISTDYFDYILYLQFVPSFINFYNQFILKIKISNPIFEIKSSSREKKRKNKK
jgi:hypothetical protein